MLTGTVMKGSTHNVAQHKSQANMNLMAGSTHFCDQNYESCYILLMGITIATNFPVWTHKPVLVHCTETISR